MQFAGAVLQEAHPLPLDSPHWTTMWRGDPGPNRGNEPVSNRQVVHFPWHGDDVDDDTPDANLLGVYASEEAAQDRIARAAGLPGFAEHPNEFGIARYAVDKNQWTSGYVEVEFPVRSIHPSLSEMCATMRNIGMASLRPVRYRASWFFSTVLLGVNLGAAGALTYASVFHDSLWPLLPAAGALIFALGFIRTGVLGPKMFDDRLQIPRAIGQSVQIPIKDISGVYLVRTLINGYGLTGWVPTLWANQRSNYLLRGLTTLRYTHNREAALATHSGLVVSDIYHRVLAAQGSAGLLATSHLGPISGVREFDRISPHPELSRRSSEGTPK
jgi:hypothetical protein